MKKQIDPEVLAFEESLLRSLDQSKRGEFAATHSAESIQARRAAGRPVGSKQSETKQPITIRLKPDVLSTWRMTGKGWQTRAAHVLETYAAKHIHA